MSHSQRKDEWNRNLLLNKPAKYKKNVHVETRTMEQAQHLNKTKYIQINY